jgi:predicted permease
VRVLLLTLSVHSVRQSCYSTCLVINVISAFCSSELLQYVSCYKRHQCILFVRVVTVFVLLLTSSVHSVRQSCYSACLVISVISAFCSSELLQCVSCY